MDQDHLGHLHSTVPPNYYHQGVKRNVLQHLWHSYRKKAIKKMINSKGGVLLDLGCHGGYLTNFIAQQIKAAQVIAVDISPEAIAFIKKNHPDWQAICANIEDKLDINDNSVDLITSFDVFEHLNKPENVIKETKRVIKPGGFFIIAVPYETWLWKIIWKLWTKIGPGKVWHEVHIQDYKKNSFDNIFTSLGFTKKSESITHMGMYCIKKFKYE